MAVKKALPTGAKTRPTKVKTKAPNEGLGRRPAAFAGTEPGSSAVPASATVVPSPSRLRHPDRKPTHPGALLREIVIPATGRGKAELSRLLGVSRQTLYDLLAERLAVTPQLALRLGKMFGDGPEPWLRMQTAHDVWLASREMAAALEAIPQIAAAQVGLETSVRRTTADRTQQLRQASR